MTFDVVLLKQPNNGYVAKPVLWPEAVAHGDTEQQALQQVELLIQELMQEARLVKVDVAIPEEKTGNPWIAKTGWFANDPAWDEFQAAIAEHRRQIDKEEQTP
jgi:predicted RNase H-like HicB family nuclease